MVWTRLSIICSRLVRARSRRCCNGERLKISVLVGEELGVESGDWDGVEKELFSCRLSNNATAGEEGGCDDDPSSGTREGVLRGEEDGVNRGERDSL